MSDNDDHQDGTRNPQAPTDRHLSHAQEIPIRYPDSVYEYKSAHQGVKWLLAYISVVSVLCFAAWIVLEMATPLASRINAILAIAFGLAVGIPSARLFQSEDRKNRQATLRYNKTSR
jgi:hypothetical protein